MTRPPALALAFAVLLAGYGLWRFPRHHPAPTRVLLLDPQPGGGLDGPESQALGFLLADELETRSNLAITLLPSLPQPFQPEGDLLVLRPQATRRGDRLALGLAWAEVGEGRAGEWHGGEALAATPAEAVETALRDAPLQLLPPNPQFLPEGAPAFWTLLRCESAVYRNAGLDAAHAEAQELATDQPRCAAAQTVLSHLDTVRLLQNPDPLDGQVDLALAESHRAAQLVPGYPRALRFYARLLSDQGHQGEALDSLKDGLAVHPDAMNLLFGVDYAARTAGLMDIALGARARIRALWGGAPEPPPTGFTYLYAGQADAFEASFRPRPAAPLDGFTEFHLGYAKLLGGKAAEAALHFQAAEGDPAAETQYRELAKVFRFQIEGRGADARAALDALDRERVGLQVPDGEFTFGIAEAAAYLGEEGRAMDLAQRAFSQGFTCTPWYEASPFLAKVQPLPRWRAILQHVDARRARVADHRAPSDFGL